MIGTSNSNSNRSGDSVDNDDSSDNNFHYA